MLDRIQLATVGRSPGLFEGVAAAAMSTAPREVRIRTSDAGPQPRLFDGRGRALLVMPEVEGWEPAEPDDRRRAAARLESAL